MKAMQHQWVVGLSLAVIAGLPVQGFAQYGYRGGTTSGPTADTPRLLVGTCHATPRQLGVDASKALRDRIQSETSPRDLYVIPNEIVNKALAQSGYTPDSALSLVDLGSLGKIVHADQLIDCDASVASGGVHLEARLLLSRDVTQTQPLAAVDAKNWGDAASQMEHEYTDSRKQMDGYTKCRDNLRDGKAQDAVKNARDAIKSYDKATLARICLAQAYIDKQVNYPPDSILAVAQQVMAIDPRNVFALQLEIGAYDRMGNIPKETEAMQKLYMLQPQDQTLALKIVDALASQADAASATKALAIVDDMLKSNPGDPTVLQQKWKLQAKLNQFPQAIITGELMVHSDAALADSAYFQRQIAMASTDSNWAKVAEYAGQAAAKFPTNSEFPYLNGVALMKVNQLPDAAAAFRKSLAITPGNVNAQLFLASIYTNLNMPDSARKIADAAIAAGGDKSKWGPMLLGPVQALLTKAQADTANATQYYKQAYDLSIHADSVAPSATAHFFIGVSAVQLAVDAMRRAQVANGAKHADEACTAAKEAQNYFVQANIHMPLGGSVDAATAANVLNAVTTYSGNADEMVKTYCKKK